ACRVRGGAVVLLTVYEFPKGYTAPTEKGAKPNYVSHGTPASVPGDGWQTRALAFTTKGNADYLKVSLITQTAGQAWFDDVELRDLSEPPDVVVPLAPRSVTVGPFFVLDGKGKESAEPTSARLSYDRDALRVSFECRESQVARMKATVTEDGAKVFTDDCVELFVKPQRDVAASYQVGVNSRGAKGFGIRAEIVRLFKTWHEVLPKPTRPAWEPKVQTGAKVGDDRWTVVVSVPWRDMGIEPRAGLELGANLTRRRHLGGEENSSWALMTGKTFHDAGQWGRFILGGDATSPTGRQVAGRASPPAPAIPDPADAKPAFAIRAYHSSAPLKGGLEEYKALVRTLAKLRFNTLMLEVNEKLKYERHPKIGHEYALTKAEMRDLVKFCRDLGFEVIPQVQTFGHFSYVLRHAEYRHLSEHAEPSPRWGFWNYCPSNPDTFKLVFDMFEEVIEVFQPKQFHIGHDEFTFMPIGVCERCKGTPPHELFSRGVAKLHEWLIGRGLKVLMWGDQLLAEHHGGPPHDTAKALPSIPRDIVICDWHYAPDEDFPSVRFFKGHGFPVIACGWFSPKNVANFSRVALEAKAEGYCMTTWWPPERVATTAETATGVALSGQFAWSPNRFKLDALPWHPTQALRATHFTPRSAGAYRTLDLSAHARTPLDETDVAAAPRGPLWSNGVPFEVTGKALVLSAKRPKAWQIPVGGRVAALHFLHCTTRPPKVIDHLYDRNNEMPKLVGRYTVHYEDG
ncbi:MAG: hypothetical protein FJ278_13285, partial [Planctomycetes bacterium]|nr:hypothetical protein [Planctomycetota bacterium]